MNRTFFCAADNERVRAHVNVAPLMILFVRMKISYKNMLGKL
jgi:hypothetical protein